VADKPSDQGRWKRLTSRWQWHFFPHRLFHIHSVHFSFSIYTSIVPVRCYGQHKLFPTSIKMIHMRCMYNIIHIVELDWYQQETICRSTILYLTFMCSLTSITGALCQGYNIPSSHIPYHPVALLVPYQVDETVWH
jgi:hypothetical protein